MQDEDHEAMTFRRALCAPEFWLLVVTGFCAAAGLAWWIVLPLSVAGLSISSLPKYVQLWSRGRCGKNVVGNGRALAAQ